MLKLIMSIKWTPLFTIFLFLFLTFLQQSNTLSTPFKVSVRLLVYEDARDIFWDLDKGTLDEESVPTLIKNGQIKMKNDQTVREAVEKAVKELNKQQEEEIFDEDGAYQIVAIFEDKQLNMQIQREMDVEPNGEYTAILLAKKGERKKTAWLY